MTLKIAHAWRQTSQINASRRKQKPPNLLGVGLSDGGWRRSGIDAGTACGLDLEVVIHPRQADHLRLAFPRRWICRDHERQDLVFNTTVAARRNFGRQAEAVVLDTAGAVARCDRDRKAGDREEDERLAQRRAVSMRAARTGTRFYVQREARPASAFDRELLTPRNSIDPGGAV